MKKISLEHFSKIKERTGIISPDELRTDQSWIQIFHADTQKHNQKTLKTMGIAVKGPLFVSI